MVWNYILGSSVAVYVLFGVYQSMTWIYQSISKRSRKQSFDLSDSAKSDDVAVDLDHIISPSRKQVDNDVRIASFNRAFSCPSRPITFEKEWKHILT